MIGQNLRGKREKILKWVTDWTDPQDHIRYEKNVNKLSYDEWFWCHPSAFLLVNYGIYIIGFLFYLFLVLYFLKNSVIYLAIIFAGFDLYLIHSFYKNYKLGKYSKNFTFYDLYLRDYIVLDKQYKEEKNGRT